MASRMAKKKRKEKTVLLLTFFVLSTSTHILNGQEKKEGKGYIQDKW